MAAAEQTTVPWLLRRAWAQSDAASEQPRRCDALDAETPHRRIETAEGAYWICARTGRMHRDIVEDDLAGLYDDIWDDLIERTQPSESDREEVRRWVRRIEPYRQTGRLFEVGCGMGLLLGEAMRAGWHAAGNDISPRVAEHAAKETGADVRSGAMETIELEAESYDVVLLNNVFEHLQQPRAVLCKLAEALRPGGVMFLQTLNGQSLSLRFAPQHWIYYGPGPLFIPTLRSFGHYFDAAGLRRKRFESHGFRSVPRGDSIEAARRRRRRFDKLMSSVASRLGRGHRVKMLLEHPAG